MKSDGRIDAGEDGGLEPPRHLSGAGLAASADGRARGIVRVIDGGADTLADTRVGGIVGGFGANVVSRSGHGALRSRRYGHGHHLRRGSDRYVGRHAWEIVAGHGGRWNEHRRPGYGGGAIIDGAMAGHISKPRVQPKANAEGCVRSRADADVGGIGGGDRRSRRRARRHCPGRSAAASDGKS